MEYFLQQLVNGITLGAIYGLIAIGYTMVYGIIGMINFAHGDIFMVGAFMALIAFLNAGLARPDRGSHRPFHRDADRHGADGLYGWTVERIAYRPLRHSFPPCPAHLGDRHVDRADQLRAGSARRPGQILAASDPGRSHSARERRRCGASRGVQIIIIVTTVVLMTAFSWLVAKTRLGRDMRACEQDLGMASLLGVDVDRTIS